MGLPLASVAGTAPIRRLLGLPEFLNYRLVCTRSGGWRSGRRRGNTAVRPGLYCLKASVGAPPDIPRPLGREHRGCRQWTILLSPGPMSPLYRPAARQYAKLRRRCAFDHVMSLLRL
ncbi:hypothetical protein KCP71_08395 [Salmonella enterica subsp. enterica]|nr:hypothetical protein KCP71_08395 [Salmonella enterica subsp. enterica]